jgi:hypothetical protein
MDGHDGSRLATKVYDFVWIGLLSAHITHRTGSPRPTAAYAVASFRPHAQRSTKYKDLLSVLGGGSRLPDLARSLRAAGWRVRERMCFTTDRPIGHGWQAESARALTPHGSVRRRLRASEDASPLPDLIARW